MNQLLGTLEELGYVVRSAAPDERGARIVRFTKRGHAAYGKMADILQDIEREWSAALGPRRFAELKTLLGALWDSPLIRLQA
jgi:DNA-binding MarR family transcriptional regulator